MENPTKMDDLGVPLFFGNIHMDILSGNSAIVTFLGQRVTSVTSNDRGSIERSGLESPGTGTLIWRNPEAYSWLLLNGVGDSLSSKFKYVMEYFLQVYYTIEI